MTQSLKTCSSCQQAIPNEAQFCPFCGYSFVASTHGENNIFEGGQSEIGTCPNCGTIYDFSIPAYCGSCGYAFPQSEPMQEPKVKTPEYFLPHTPFPGFEGTRSDHEYLNLSKKRDANTPPVYTPHGNKSSRKRQTSLLLWIIFGTFFLLGVVILGVSGFLMTRDNAFVANVPSQSIFENSVQSTLTFTPTTFSTVSLTDTVIPTEVLPSTPTDIPTYTPTSVPTLTDSPLPTATLALSCPGAQPPRVSIGDEVVVCTKKDRLIVFAAPNTPDNNEDEIFRVYPGSQLVILGGPTCSDNSWWWQVKVAVGSKAARGQTELSDFFYTTEESTGWVREGSDNIDPYYICKQ